MSIATVSEKETITFIKDGRTKTITSEKTRKIDDSAGRWEFIDIDIESIQVEIPYNYNSELFFVRSMVGK